MKYLSKQTFICIDCETTGLNPEMDRIIEIGALVFTLEQELQEFESLVDPGRLIPASSQAIHHISDEMVQGKPTIESLLPDILKLAGRKIIIGHGVDFDIQLLVEAAKRANMPCRLQHNLRLDTLRLGRLYGESPTFSLEGLRKHFNIPPEKAHRALDDARTNARVFRRLVHSFRTLEEVQRELKKPIRMRRMPLGKYKGRPFEEIPVDYLQWALSKDFDRDLMHSIRYELSRRRKGDSFRAAANPFKTIF